MPASSQRFLLLLLPYGFLYHTSTINVRLLVTECSINYTPKFEILISRRNVDEYPCLLEYVAVQMDKYLQTFRTNLFGLYFRTYAVQKDPVSQSHTTVRCSLYYEILEILNLI